MNYPTISFINFERLKKFCNVPDIRYFNENLNKQNISNYTLEIILYLIFIMIIDFYVYLSRHIIHYFFKNFRRPRIALFSLKNSFIA